MWKSIDDRYEVSDSGEIRKQNRILCQWAKNNKGYRVASLWKDGVEHRPFVHKLVLEAFVGEKPEGNQAHHKNHDTSDNMIENLEWVTCSENIRQNRLSGRKIARQKLTEYDVQFIRMAYRCFGVTQKSLSEKFAINAPSISNIVHGKEWKHLLRLGGS